MIEAVHRTRDERGASGAEYDLLITGIAVVIITAVVVFGSRVSDLFGDSCDSVASATSAGTCS